MTDTHTAIILVTDRVDSTAQRTRVGEDAAESLRRHHDALLAEAITARHGTIVKHLGDGVLATFVGAAEAVAAAIAIQQSVDGHFELRVGVSAGDVTIENDDVFGLPVIEASRLCAHAAGGQILVSDLARMLARGRGGHSFESMGALELKGLPDAVMASEVAWDRLDDTRVPYPAALVNTSTLPYSGRGDTLERCFGEMSLLDDLPRSATVTTRVATTLLAIDRPTFQNLVLGAPQIALALMTELALRLRDAQSD